MDRTNVVIHYQIRNIDRMDYDLYKKTTAINKYIIIVNDFMKTNITLYSMLYFLNINLDPMKQSEYCK